MQFFGIPDPVNRAFLSGDTVKAYFFVRNSQLIMAEECYFFLMASMRKMRMQIPLEWTLDFFENLFEKTIFENQLEHGIVEFMAYRNHLGQLLAKSEVSYFYSFSEKQNIFQLEQDYELDLLKEITVNTHLLSSIHVHTPENIYAEIYAAENELDDVILLNPQKRIARTTCGNLLFLQNNLIKIPKQEEGAFISPLMENFVTFLHRKNYAEIVPLEMLAFESQKADEILLISDAKGIFPVTKIRNKNFEKSKFSGWIEEWRETFKGIKQAEH